jgi:hypothetical protein
MIYGGLLEGNVYKIKNTGTLLVANVAFENMGT